MKARTAAHTDTPGGILGSVAHAWLTDSPIPQPRPRLQPSGYGFESRVREQSKFFSEVFFRGEIARCSDV